MEKNKNKEDSLVDSHKPIKVGMDQYAVNERIEKIIKALGTMVIHPIENTNPDTFKKEYIGSVQKPILEGENREKVLNKLVELIVE